MVADGDDELVVLAGVVRNRLVETDFEDACGSFEFGMDARRIGQSRLDFGLTDLTSRGVELFDDLAAEVIEHRGGGEELIGVVQGEIAKRPENKGKKIVALLPDTGERYLSTVLYAFDEYPL